MHPYRQRWSDDPETWIPPQLGEFRFTNPLDVVADAELDPVLRWRIDPEIWHLDARGRLCCGTHASSLDSVRTLCRRPGRLARAGGRRSAGRAPAGG
jgi:hypothetical protein